MLDKVEEILGHKIDIKLQGSVNNLNEFSEYMINQLKLMPHPVLAEQLAGFYVAKPSHKFVKLFVEQVVYGNEPVATWLKGRTLIPDFSLLDLLTKQSNEILMPIGGEFKQLIKPLRKSWEGGSASPGAPARREPDATYLSDKPVQAVSLSLTDVVPVTNPVIAYRRWLAQRTARYLYGKNHSFTLDTVAGDKYLPDISLWTKDAIASFDGLRNEFLSIKYKADDVPGFCGPDEWYTQDL
jgi:hypothetical protein